MLHIQKKKKKKNTLTKTFEEGCHKAVLLSTEDIMIYFPEAEKTFHLKCV